MAICRRGSRCRRCEGDTIPLEAEHSIFAALMYVCAAVGGAMVIAAFVALPILVLYSLIPLGVAVVFNIIDDRMIDAAALEKLEQGPPPRTPPPPTHWEEEE